MCLKLPECTVCGTINTCLGSWSGILLLLKCPLGGAFALAFREGKEGIILHDCN